MATTKPLPPATGSVQWLPREVNGNPRLRIVPESGEPGVYEVERKTNGLDTAFVLHSIDPRTFAFKKYTLVYVTGERGPDGSNRYLSCDCPDASKRPERRCACKHARGLAAALAKPSYPVV